MRPPHNAREILRRAQDNLAMNQRWFSQAPSEFGDCVIGAAEANVAEARAALEAAQSKPGAQ